MGLFDFFKRKQDWELDDEPELRPDRQLPAAKPADASSPSSGAAASAGPGGAAKAKQPEPDAAAAPAPEAAEEDMPDFGIQKAIELMRDLPQKDSEVVVQAVCKTLASIGVEVPDIIDQAKDKQDKITGRIKNLRGEIADLEEEIAGRKEEIKALEADHKETGDVRSRLEKATTAPKAPAPAGNGKKDDGPTPTASASGSLGKPAADKAGDKLSAPPKHGTLGTPSLTPSPSTFKPD